MKAILEKLGIEETNAGACTGPDGWIRDPAGQELISYNPATEEPIAAVVQATTASYQTVSAAAQSAFLEWRTVPAPKRGQVVRDLGEAVREL